MPRYLKQSGSLSMWQPRTSTDHGVSLMPCRDFKIRAHPFPSKRNKSNRDQRSVFVFVSMCQTHTIKDVCMWSLACDDIADVFSCCCTVTLPAVKQERRFAPAYIYISFQWVISVEWVGVLASAGTLISVPSIAPQSPLFLSTLPLSVWWCGG